MLRAQVWRVIEVTIEGKSSKLRALFDTGSTFTVMGYETLKRVFGDVSVKTLPKPVKATLVNGQQVTMDAFVDAQIVIKGLCNFRKNILIKRHTERSCN